MDAQESEIREQVCREALLEAGEWFAQRAGLMTGDWVRLRLRLIAEDLPR